MTGPGQIAGWPKLVLMYRTDPASLAALLPPGIEPGEAPIVQIGVYCVPVRDEPEYGVSTKVMADYDGIAGWYSIGMGIDQESAIFISQELNGQPKFPCEIEYFLHGDSVVARCIHQGYTFLEFSGMVNGSVDPSGDDVESNEWWIKSIRAINGVAEEFDYPPHVVRVRMVSEAVETKTIDGELRLLDSPWDPYTTHLPMLELLSAELVMSRHKAREITNAGALDPIAFWPFADVIGGSRWPGERGGPKLSS